MARVRQSETEAAETGGVTQATREEIGTEAVIETKIKTVIVTATVIVTVTVTVTAKETEVEIGSGREVATEIAIETGTGIAIETAIETGTVIVTETEIEIEIETETTSEIVAEMNSETTKTEAETTDLHLPRQLIKALAMPQTLVGMMTPTLGRSDKANAEVLCCLAEIVPLQTSSSPLCKHQLGSQIEFTQRLNP